MKCAVVALQLVAMLCTARCEPGCGVAFILLGSTGDLAKRYLLPSLFANMAASSECTVVTLAGLRRPVTDYHLQWTSLTGNIGCPRDDTTCEEDILKFQERFSFVQLGSEDDYKYLQSVIHDEMTTRNLTEIGRVFYLSVPSSAYGEILKFVDVYARPSLGVWLRVVMEKPFGHDYASALRLADDIVQYLQQDEVYLVDHYLGKLGVQQIMRFRTENSNKLSPLWNSKHIQHIEVVARERLDVRGRSRFYDNYGVVRDMVQNHLTEILLRLVTDTVGNFLKLKSEAIASIIPPRLEHAVLGQYAGYQDHLREDGVASSHTQNFSRTPTFVSVLLHLRDPVFTAVPVMLTSGKRLGERKAFARVLFKEAAFPIMNCRPEIIFIIQDELLLQPGVLISQHFNDIKMPFDGWKIKPYQDANCSYSFVHPAEEVENNAYVSIIAGVLQGERERFIDVESLLDSWKVWSPLLEEYELSQTVPTQYTSSDTAPHITLLGRQPNHPPPIHPDHPPLIHPNDPPFLFSHSPNSSFAGFNAVIAHKYALATHLAESLHHSALASIKQRGTFHLALSGGTSPVLLLQTLTLKYQYRFPWQYTHIWQVDERCVGRTSSESNLRMILKHFSVPIPYLNIHPMPVELQSGLCNASDGGTELYEHQIMKYSVNGSLDYIVLGMGQDGHFASLFPTRSQLHSSGTFVKLVTLETTYPIEVKSRMTLSLEAIVMSRCVSLLAVGRGKGRVVRVVEGCMAAWSAHCDDLPVAKLLQQLRHTQLQLYIEKQLLN